MPDLKPLPTDELFRDQLAALIGKCNHYVLSHPDEDHLLPLKLIMIAEQDPVIRALQYLLPDVEPAPAPGAGWPRAWRLFSFVLDHRTRQRVFGPSFEELKEDYCLACSEVATRRGWVWLHVAFTLRSARMVWQCVRAMVGDRALKWWAAGLAALTKFLGR